MYQASRDIDLSSADLRDYFEIGWITRRALFDPDEVARMRSCFDDLEHAASELTETGLHEGAYFVLGENGAGRSSSASSGRVDTSATCSKSEVTPA